MKFRYQFVNETVDVEIDEKWCAVLLDLERRAYNNNQTETRRHASLDAFNLDGTLFPSDEDVEADCIQNAEFAALHKALSRLLPQQQELIKKVFFEKRSIAGIAREEGVVESAIRDRLNRIYKKIKLLLK